MCLNERRVLSYLLVLVAAIVVACNSAPSPHTQTRRRRKRLKSQFPQLPPKYPAQRPALR